MILPNFRGILVRGEPVKIYYVVATSENNTGNIVHSWRFSNGSFGTKYADPASPPTGVSARRACFSPNGNHVAIGWGASPYIAVYDWTVGSGFGTKFADPGTLISGAIATNVQFSPNGNNIAASHTNSPYISAYSWSGSGFGTKFSDPAVIPGSSANRAQFSKDGAYLAVGENNAPRVSVYRWSDSGFGTRFSNPGGTALQGSGLDVTFSYNNSYIAVAMNLTPWGAAYNWSDSGFGTRFSNPTTAMSATRFGVDFNIDNDLIAFGGQSVSSTNAVNVYQWSGSGFGTRYSFETFQVQGRQIVFSPDGRYIMMPAISGTPNIGVFVWPFDKTTGFGTRVTPANYTSGGWGAAFRPFV